MQSSMTSVITFIEMVLSRIPGFLYLGSSVSDFHLCFQMKGIECARAIRRTKSLLKMLHPKL